MDPLVSIIVPTYNEERNIAKCLENISNQDCKNLEIIVVDNFSKDRTLFLAKRYTSKCFRRGKERSAQRNFGAQKAQGRWLFFVDADQKVSPKLVSRCTEKIKNDKKVKALIIAESTSGENFWSKCRDFEKRIYFGDNFVEAARFFDKCTFFQLGGFDELLVAGEDWDLTARLKAKKYKVERISTPLINFGEITLFSAAKKKFYYGQKIGRYIAKNPELVKKQLSLIRFTSYLNPRLFPKQPILALGLLVLKTVEFVSGAAGLLYGKISKEKIT